MMAQKNKSLLSRNLKAIKEKLGCKRPTEIIEVQPNFSDIHYFQGDPRDEKTASEFNFESSFHCAVGPVLFYVEFFSLFPVANIMDRDPKNIKFSIFSFRFLYSLIVMGSGILELIMKLYSMPGERIDLDSLGDCVYFIACCLGCYFLIRMASKWQSIIEYWNRSESIFLVFPYKERRFKLKYKMRLFCFSLLAVATIEHIFYVIATCDLAYVKVTECNFNITVHEYILRTTKQHFYLLLPNHVLSILYCECLNIIMTIGWVFVDVFIMAISIALYTRFDQITDRLETISGMNIPEHAWVELREHYVTVCEIVRFMDGHLAPIIFLSCSNNLFFICQQIFNSFEEMPVQMWAIYFGFSVFYLVSRSFYVLYFAALVNDASRGPIEILRKIPKESWCIETQRFAEQCSCDCVALTGNRFFFLTRRLLFAMFGTVITYELVLNDHIKSDIAPKEFCVIPAT